MTILRYLFVTLALVMALGTGASVAAQQPTPAPVDEFVPISELPPQDQLPAAPLLVAAYVVVILVLFGYVFSLARRLSTVKQELKQLEATIGRSRRE